MECQYNVYENTIAMQVIKFNYSLLKQFIVYVQSVTLSLNTMFLLLFLHSEPCTAYR